MPPISSSRKSRDSRSAVVSTAMPRRRCANSGRPRAGRSDRAVPCERRRTRRRSCRPSPGRPASGRGRRCPSSGRCGRRARRARRAPSPQGPATPGSPRRRACRLVFSQDHMATTLPATKDEVQAGLASAGYLPGESTALVAFLATRLGKPVLVEGPAGVGKTELAKALSRYLDRTLVRLQCYEGLDEAKALYEW